MARGLMLTRKGQNFMLELERAGVIRKRSWWVRLNHWVRFGIPLW